MFQNTLGAQLEPGASRRSTDCRTATKLAEPSGDTKLKGQVALKNLPEAFAEDRDRRARFEREASSLIV